MINRLLLTGVETALVVAVGVLVAVFVYLMVSRIISDLLQKKANKSNKKLAQKVYENAEQQNKEQKQEKNKNDKYTEILDKVHQNREQFFKDEAQQEVVAPEVTQDALPSKDLEENLDDEFGELFNDNDLDGFFAENTPKVNFDVNEMADKIRPDNLAIDSYDKPDFASEFRRKKMLKRNQTIGKEINSCSSRIKAIIALDILNKKKF